MPAVTWAPAGTYTLTMMADWEVAAAMDTLAGEGEGQFIMCRSIDARLRGMEVAIFRVIDHENLIAVKSGGRLVCIDDTATVRRAGVVPIEGSGERPCSVCDGSPLPASLLLEDDDRDMGK